MWNDLGMLALVSMYLPCITIPIYLYISRFSKQAMYQCEMNLLCFGLVLLLPQRLFETSFNLKLSWLVVGCLVLLLYLRLPSILLMRRRRRSSPFSTTHTLWQAQAGHRHGHEALKGMVSSIITWSHASLWLYQTEMHMRLAHIAEPLSYAKASCGII